MNKGMLITILLIILLVAITTITIFFIRTKINDRNYNKGKILYEDNLDSFLNIINFVLIGIIFIQIIMSLRGRQYGGVVATVTLAIINLNRRPSKLVITEYGVGVGDQFNGILQFITWDKLTQWNWDKSDSTVLFLDSKAKDSWMLREFKIKDCDVMKVDAILGKYFTQKSEFIRSGK